MDEKQFDAKLEEFKKYDGGKPMITLVEPSFILGVANVLTFGAEKYGKYNWKKGFHTSPSVRKATATRVLDALNRHLIAYSMGEKLDPETGLSHLYHISANVMFLAYNDDLDSDGCDTEEHL